MARFLAVLPVVFGGSLLSACAADDDGGAQTETATAGTGEAIEYDFSEVDQRLASFIATHDGFEGASLVLVERGRGQIHQAAFGTYDPDEVALLASSSKMPSVLALLALSEDPSVDFDMSTPVGSYVPWTSAWPDMTTEQLVSNRSGIPGLQHLDRWGLHICQASPNAALQTCGQIIFENPIEGLELHPPGTHFDYGGSQWQLAGAIAEVVGNASWNELIDRYLGRPCELDVFTYGNMLANPDAWRGDPQQLIGQSNPNIEGGGISNVDDYAKLLSIHLDDGKCGDTQVVSPQALQAMRRDTGSATGSREADFGFGPIGFGYGMGWWVVPADDGEPYLFVDPGAYGAVSWIDMDRGYGGFVAIGDYENYRTNAPDSWAVVVEELIPLAEAAIDGSRP
jgi:CubicO group peptidase (beta-lactamase class C family)